MFPLPLMTWNERDSSTPMSWKCRKSTAPGFDHPGIWYKIGDGQQQLHIVVCSDSTIRRDKWIDLKDIHFALRVKSYHDTIEWLRGKVFRDSVPDSDLRKMRLRPDSLAGFPQIYILDPDRNIIEFNCETMD